MVDWAHLIGLGLGLSYIQIVHGDPQPWCRTSGKIHLTSPPTLTHHHPKRSFVNVILKLTNEMERNGWHTLEYHTKPRSTTVKKKWTSIYLNTTDPSPKPQPNQPMFGARPLPFRIQRASTIFLEIVEPLLLRHITSPPTFSSHTQRDSTFFFSTNWRLIHSVLLPFFSRKFGKLCYLCQLSLAHPPFHRLLHSMRLPSLEKVVGSTSVPGTNLPYYIAHPPVRPWSA